MAISDLAPLCVGLFAGSLLIEAFVLGRTLKKRDLRLFLPLSLNLATIVIMPVALVISGQLGSLAMQELFLSGFVFCLSVLVIYLLFTSSRGLPITFGSLFLLYAGLQSFLAFCSASYEFRVTIFAYRLIDETALSALIALCLVTISPLYRQISYKVNALLDARHLNGLSQNVGHKTKSNTRTNSSHENGPNTIMRKAIEDILPEAAKHLRKHEYARCIELCDAEVQRLLFTKLPDLYSAKTDIPTSLQEQIDMIESKGIAVPGKSILRLRSLRNTLTMSSEEATIDQAKWAIKVVRKASRVISSDHRSPQPILNQQL